MLPVMSNIVQCFMGDWERIAVADPEGVGSPSPLLNILWKEFGLTETKLFHFHGIFKINEIKLAKRTPTPLYLWTPIPGLLDQPLHLDVYLENSLI